MISWFIDSRQFLRFEWKKLYLRGFNLKNKLVQIYPLLFLFKVSLNQILYTTTTFHSWKSNFLKLLKRVFLIIVAWKSRRIKEISPLFFCNAVKNEKLFFFSVGVGAEKLLRVHLHYKEKCAGIKSFCLLVICINYWMWAEFSFIRFTIFLLFFIRIVIFILSPFTLFYNFFIKTKTMKE